MNRWKPYADERTWWQGQLDTHQNEIPASYRDEDVSPCLACGCEWCEDDISPETGLCVRCTPLLAFEVAVDDYYDEDNPYQRERDYWRRCITCLK